MKEQRDGRQYRELCILDDNDYTPVAERPVN